MIKESSFKELLGQVIQEEADGVFPPSQKRRGLRLPGLSEAMAQMDMKEMELAESIGLSDRAIRHYKQQTRGVKGIQSAEIIAIVLRCSLKDLTTYKELQRYRNPLNSRSDRKITVNGDSRTTIEARHRRRLKTGWRLLSRIFG